MKAAILQLVFACLLFSCSNMCREKIVDKSEHFMAEEQEVTAAYEANNMNL